MSSSIIFLCQADWLNIHEQGYSLMLEEILHEKYRFWSFLVNRFQNCLHFLFIVNLDF